MGQAMIGETTAREVDLFERGQAREMSEVGVGDEQVTQLKLFEPTHPLQVHEPRTPDAREAQLEPAEAGQVPQVNQPGVGHRLAAVEMKLFELFKSTDMGHQG